MAVVAACIVATSSRYCASIALALGRLLLVSRVSGGCQACRPRGHLAKRVPGYPARKTRRVLGRTRTRWRVVPVRVNPPGTRVENERVAPLSIVYVAYSIISDQQKTGKSIGRTADCPWAGPVRGSKLFADSRF